MSQCDMDFQFIPSHIMQNSQHFEPIQFVNGIFKFLPTFQINDSKVTIDLDDFPFIGISGVTTSYSIITTNYMFLLE